MRLWTAGVQSKAHCCWSAPLCGWTSRSRLGINIAGAGGWPRALAYTDTRRAEGWLSPRLPPPLFPSVLLLFLLCSLIQTMCRTGRGDMP